MPFLMFLSIDETSSFSLIPIDEMVSMDSKILKKDKEIFFVTRHFLKFSCQ